MWALFDTYIISVWDWDWGMKDWSQQERIRPVEEAGL
jgi:hypothetical protein